MASSLAARPGPPPQQGSCPSDAEWLAYIPGTLRQLEASSLSAHLATCPDCQSRLTTLRHRAQRAGVDATSPPPTSDAAAQRPPSGSDAPTTLLPPRTRLPAQIGQYRLIKQIGRGGMGLVYLAQHVRLGRTVAIKLLPGLKQRDQSAITRLQREIAAAGRLQHENIVFATDANEEDGCDYLVMEHIAGIDISRLVATVGPLPCPAACEIIRQAALGLAHIHACGMVHRDLKPSNLMLAQGGIVKILDLGLALLQEGHTCGDESPTETGYLLGTADYVSPEQLHDPHDADVRSDLYSLGCTFYKLLAGQAPFSGSEHSSLAKKLDAHRFAAPPSLRALRDDVPAAVESLLMRLLAKERSQRIQDPRELAEILAPLAAGADLAALYDRTGPHDEIEDVPPLQPSATPQPDNSTHSQGKTPTPLGQLVPGPARLATRRIIAAAVVACAVGGIGWATWLIASSQRPAVPHKSTASGKPGAIDLTRPLESLRWEGYRRSPPPRYSLEDQMLEVRSDSYQLIPLGTHDGRPGTFEVTIQQSPWHGDAGLFFGYRLEPWQNRPPLSMFQLIWLDHFPLTNPKFEKIGGRARIDRERAIIQPGPEDIREEAHAKQRVALPARQRVRLKVQFGPAGCEGVWLDGQPLADLAADKINAQYRPEDYLGPWGLYNHRDFAGSQPTWFGDVTFTPLEK